MRLDTIQLRSKGGLDLFVAKLNSATGKITWAKRAGSLGNDGANDLVVLGNSVYVAGVFSSTISFDDLELQGSADGNGFLVKLTDTGPTTTAEWGLPIVGQNKTSVFNLAVSGQNLYVNGEYKKAVPVGTTPPTLPGSDIGTFIAKVTDAGTTGRLEWMKEVAKVGQVGLVDLAVVGNQVYLAGNVKANAELDTIRVNISNSF